MRVKKPAFFAPEDLPGSGKALAGNTLYLRIRDPECRRKPASGPVKADWRPHSSRFCHLLILLFMEQRKGTCEQYSVLENLGSGVQAQACFRTCKGGLASALQRPFFPSTDTTFLWSARKPRFRSSLNGYGLFLIIGKRAHVCEEASPLWAASVCYGQA